MDSIAFSKQNIFENKRFYTIDSIGTVQIRMVNTPYGEIGIIGITTSEVSSTHMNRTEPDYSILTPATTTPK